MQIQTTNIINIKTLWKLTSNQRKTEKLLNLRIGDFFDGFVRTDGISLFAAGWHRDTGVSTGFQNILVNSFCDGWWPLVNCSFHSTRDQFAVICTPHHCAHLRQAEKVTGYQPMYWKLPTLIVAITNSEANEVSQLQYVSKM